MNIRQSNAEKMIAHYKAWVASGQSLTSYCRSNNIEHRKLQYWHYKLKSKQEPSSSNNIISPVNNIAPSKNDEKIIPASLPKQESSSEGTVRYCTHCHKPFEAFRKDTQYCSPTCKQMSYMDRQQSISNDIAPINAMAIKQVLPTEQASTSSFKQITLTPDPVVSFVEIHYPSGIIVKLNQAANLEMLKIFLS